MSEYQIIATAIVAVIVALLAGIFSVWVAWLSRENEIIKLRNGWNSTLKIELAAMVGQLGTMYRAVTQETGSPTQDKDLIKTRLTNNWDIFKARQSYCISEKKITDDEIFKFISFLQSRTLFEGGEKIKIEDIEDNIKSKLNDCENKDKLIEKLSEIIHYDVSSNNSGKSLGISFYEYDQDKIKKSKGTFTNENPRQPIGINKSLSRIKTKLRSDAQREYHLLVPIVAGFMCRVRRCPLLAYLLPKPPIDIDALHKKLLTAFTELEGAYASDKYGIFSDSLEAMITHGRNLTYAEWDDARKVAWYLHPASYLFVFLLLANSFLWSPGFWEQLQDLKDELGQGKPTEAICSPQIINNVECRKPEIIINNAPPIINEGPIIVHPADVEVKSPIVRVEPTINVGPTNVTVEPTEVNVTCEKCSEVKTSCIPPDEECDLFEE